MITELMTIILVIIFIAIIMKLMNNSLNIENMDADQLTWSKGNCGYEMTKVFLDVLNEYNIKETNRDDWNVFLPCTYNNITDTIEKINPVNSNQMIFLVNNSDSLASKSDLWKNLVKKYGRDKACEMSPNTYVLYDNNDIELLKSEYDKNKIYIMKKNIQRQEGLKITTDLNEILNGDEDYVVVQELLQDPMIINGRKMNMRFYVLVVCDYGVMHVYVHKEGFMYYTKLPFEKNSNKQWSNITTGYIDRWVYMVNPLTHGDFKTYLGKKDSEIVFDRIYELLKDICLAVPFQLCNGKFDNNISFQLFGADIAVNNKLIPQIIEFNIGPNLETHDGRDSYIKHMVVRDIFKTLNLIPNDDNGFIQII